MNENLQMTTDLFGKTLSRLTEMVARWLANVDVRAEVARLRAEKLTKLEISAERVLTIVSKRSPEEVIVKRERMLQIALGLLGLAYGCGCLFLFPFRAHCGFPFGCQR